MKYYEHGLFTVYNSIDECDIYNLYREFINMGAVCSIDKITIEDKIIDLSNEDLKKYFGSIE